MAPVVRPTRCVEHMTLNYLAGESVTCHVKSVVEAGLTRDELLARNLNCACTVESCPVLHREPSHGVWLGSGRPLAR